MDATSIIGDLAALAGNRSVALYQTLSSFQSEQQRVGDLTQETGALADVLRALQAAVSTNPKLQTAILEIPLRSCAKVCAEFDKQVQQLSSRSDEGTISLHGWTGLRYIGEDISGFRRVLSAYKMTITVALTDASM